MANGVFGNDFWNGTWVGNLPEEQVAVAPQSAALPAAEAQAAAAAELVGTLARTGLSSLRDVGGAPLEIDAAPAGGHGTAVAAAAAGGAGHGHGAR